MIIFEYKRPSQDADMDWEVQPTTNFSPCGRYACRQIRRGFEVVDVRSGEPLRPSWNWESLPWTYDPPTEYIVVWIPDMLVHAVGVRGEDVCPTFTVKAIANEVGCRGNIVGIHRIRDKQHFIVFRVEDKTTTTIAYVKAENLLQSWDASFTLHSQTTIKGVPFAEGTAVLPDGSTYVRLLGGSAVCVLPDGSQKFRTLKVCPPDTVGHVVQGGGLLAEVGPAGVSVLSQRDGRKLFGVDLATAGRPARVLLRNGRLDVYLVGGAKMSWPTALSLRNVRQFGAPLRRQAFLLRAMSLAGDRLLAALAR